MGESPHAPVGTYMADHPDRHVCGKTGFTLWRTGADGKRLPIPKNNKPVQAQVVEAPKKLLPRRRARNEEPFSLKSFWEMCARRVGSLLHGLLQLLVEGYHPSSR